MGIAESLGLPVESINHAGAYFLRKVPGFREHLVLLHKGPSVRIFRPEVELFIKLKLSRLSPSDLLDCIHFVKWANEHNEIWNGTAVTLAIKSELKRAQDGDRKTRLQELLKTVAPP